MCRDLLGQPRLSHSSGSAEQETGAAIDLGAQRSVLLFASDEGGTDGGPAPTAYVPIAGTHAWSLSMGMLSWSLTVLERIQMTS